MTLSRRNITSTFTPCQESWAQETLEAARLQADQIVSAARDKGDEALQQAAKMVRTARQQSVQIISEARREAEQIITAARDYHLCLSALAEEPMRVLPATTSFDTGGTEFPRNISKAGLTRQIGLPSEPAPRGDLHTAVGAYTEAYSKLSLKKYSPTAAL